MKRRNAIEPIIGHLKSGHRLSRNYLRGILGDGRNVILTACRFNMKKLLRAFLYLQLRSFLESMSNAKQFFEGALLRLSGIYRHYA